MDRTLGFDRGFVSIYSPVLDTMLNRRLNPLQVSVIDYILVLILAYITFQDQMASWGLLEYSTKNF